MGCYLCGKDNLGLLFRAEGHRVVRCRGCGLVQVRPRATPQQLRDVYRQGYFKSPAARHCGYQDYFGERENYLKTFRRRFARLRRWFRLGDAVLEVGIGGGFFLKVLQDAGIARLHGSDVSAYGVERARELLGPDADLRAGTLAECGFTGPFDVIVLWDVVEHMADPLAELRIVRRLIRPTGRLIVETQDVGSLLARATGPRWHMYKFPEHQYHFDRRTVQHLLGEAGFEVKSISPRGAGKYLSGDFIKERIGRYSPLLQPVMNLCAPLIRHLYVNLFDEMIVVARPV